jgi:hypothetical protein
MTAMNESDDRRIDDALRAAFTPPPPAAFAAAAAAAVRAPRRRFWPWLAAAALLLLGVALVLTINQPRRGPEGHDGQALGAIWVASFEDAVSQGFGGSPCCRTPIDLPRDCQAACGVRLDLLRRDGVSVLGTYCGLSTGGCMALLAEADGAPVCVYVLPCRKDPRVVVPAASPLLLARRELGSVVLYALSHRDPGPLLDRFLIQP